MAFDADLLLHDAQYTTEQYEFRQGWGHSSMEDTIEFALLTRVKRLLLTHHDPLHSDEDLDKIYVRLKEKLPASVPFEMAVEGMEIVL